MQKMIKSKIFWLGLVAGIAGLASIAATPVGSGRSTWWVFNNYDLDGTSKTNVCRVICNTGSFTNLRATAGTLTTVTTTTNVITVLKFGGTNYTLSAVSHTNAAGSANLVLVLTP